MADIGSDHAYLPIYLLERGIITGGVAGELNEGPFRGAERNVRARGYADRLAVRRGNGLAVVEPGEVDVITVAGMGGGTIREILAAGVEKLAGVQRLVLSPQGDSDGLRRWLLGQGWMIIAEDLLIEDDKLYEIIVWERGAMEITDPMAYEFGPLLLASKHPLLVARIDYEVGKIDRAIRQIEKAGADAAERVAALTARKHQLEEVKQRVS